MNLKDILGRLEEMNIRASELANEIANLAPSDDPQTQGKVAPVFAKAHGLVTNLALLSAAIRISSNSAEESEKVIGSKKTASVQLLPNSSRSGAEISTAPAKNWHQVVVSEALHPSLSSMGQGWIRPGKLELNFYKKDLLSADPTEVKNSWPEGFYCTVDSDTPKLLLLKINTRIPKTEGPGNCFILDFSGQTEEFYMSAGKVEDQSCRWQSSRYMTVSLIQNCKMLMVKRLTELLENVTK